MHWFQQESIVSRGNFGDASQNIINGSLTPSHDNRPAIVGYEQTVLSKRSSLEAPRNMKAHEGIHYVMQVVAVLK